MSAKKGHKKSSHSDRPVVDAIREHRQQMQEGGMPVYRLFDAIEGADLADADKDALRKEASKLVESVLSGRVKVGSKAFETMETIVAMGMPLAREALAAWGAAAEAARSARGLRSIVHDFGGWLSLVSVDNRDEFYEALPRLAPGELELRKQGTSELLRTAGSLKSRDDFRAVLQMVAKYGSGPAPILSGMSRVARGAISVGHPELIEELDTAMRAPRVINYHDGLRMVSAMAKLSEFCCKRSNTVWQRAFQLVIALGSETFESVTIAARDLPKCMETLSSKHVVDYLQDVRSLVEEVGVGASWFGLRKLPGIYRNHGPETARRFVQGATAVAAAHGPTAGWWFLEQKTGAARRVLQGK